MGGNPVGYILSKNAEELIAGIEQLHSDLTIEYELFVTNLVKKSASEDFERDLLDFLSSDLDEDLRYAAFYCLAILYRYQKAFEKAERHLNSYVETFKDKASYSHLRLLHRLAGGFPLTIRRPKNCLREYSRLSRARRCSSSLC